MTAKTTKTAPFADDAKIRIVAKENPKRPGTKAHKLFSIYRPGMTVAQYRDAVVALRGVRPRRARSSLRYDVRHGYVAVVPAAKAPAKRAAKAA